MSRSWLAAMAALPATGTISPPGIAGEPRIWVATWGDARAGSPDFVPMVVLAGSFRPLGDNESIDPETLARQLAQRPKGRRALLLSRYCSSFWGVRGDEIPAPDGKLVASPWPRVAIREIQREWPRTLELIKHCGGSIDLLVGDFEEWGRFSTWWASDAQIDAIRSDRRWTTPAADGVMPSTLAREVSGQPAGEVRRAGPGRPYLQWNMVVGKLAADAMSEAIWKPATAVFPGIMGCNYQGHRSIDRPAADGHGHLQPQDNIFGSAAAPSLYGEIESIVNLYVDPSDPTKVAWSGVSHFRRNPWTSFLLCTQQARACARSAPEVPLTPWIANRSYAGENPEAPVVGFVLDPRTYDENVRHICLLGAPNLLWWRSGSESTAEDTARLVSVIRETNDHALGRIREPADVQPISYLSEVVVSGGRRHDGKWLWRVTASPEVAMLREVGTGREWSPTADSLGFWVETAQKVAPKWEVARRRDPSDPPLARPIKPAPPP